MSPELLRKPLHYDSKRKRLWIWGQRCHHGATGVVRDIVEPPKASSWANGSNNASPVRARPMIEPESAPFGAYEPDEGRVRALQRGVFTN